MSRKDFTQKEPGRADSNSKVDGSELSKRLTELGYLPAHTVSLLFFLSLTTLYLFYLIATFPMMVKELPRTAT